MRKGISAAVFNLIVCVLILQACSKIPCYSASHFAPLANANYTAEEVRLKAPAGHTLAGTLTLPSDRPTPSGSGADHWIEPPEPRHDGPLGLARVRIPAVSSNRRRAVITNYDY
jgi:hypothetical protein